MRTTTEKILDRLDEMNISYELEENKVTDRLTMETKDIIEIELDELTEEEAWETLDKLEQVASHVITSYNDGFETRETILRVVA